LRLEALARQYLLAISAGKPVLLGEEDMAEVARRYQDYGRQPRARTKARWMVP
jgi:L-fuculose-phosphate aldolase